MNINDANVSQQEQPNGIRKMLTVSHIQATGRPVNSLKLWFDIFLHFFLVTIQMQSRMLDKRTHTNKRAQK